MSGGTTLRIVNRGAAQVGVTVTTGGHTTIYLVHGGTGYDELLPASVEDGFVLGIEGTKIQITVAEDGSSYTVADHKKLRWIADRYVLTIVIDDTADPVIELRVVPAPMTRSGIPGAYIYGVAPPATAQASTP